MSKRRAPAGSKPCLVYMECGCLRRVSNRVRLLGYAWCHVHMTVTDITTVVQTNIKEVAPDPAQGQLF